MGRQMPDLSDMAGQRVLRPWLGSEGEETAAHNLVVWSFLGGGRSLLCSGSALNTPPPAPHPQPCVPQELPGPHDGAGEGGLCPLPGSCLWGLFCPFSLLRSLHRSLRLCVHLFVFLSPHLSPCESLSLCLFLCLWSLSTSLSLCMSLSLSLRFSLFFFVSLRLWRSALAFPSPSLPVSLLHAPVRTCSPSTRCNLPPPPEPPARPGLRL